MMCHPGAETWPPTQHMAYLGIGSTQTVAIRAFAPWGRTHGSGMQPLFVILRHSWQLLADAASCCHQ